MISRWLLSSRWRDALKSQPRIGMTLKNGVPDDGVDDDPAVP